MDVSLFLYFRVHVEAGFCICGVVQPIITFGRVALIYIIYKVSASTSEHTLLHLDYVLKTVYEDNTCLLK